MEAGLISDLSNCFPLQDRKWNSLHRAEIPEVWREEGEGCKLVVLWKQVLHACTR